MADAVSFLPRRQSDVLIYAQQMHAVVAADGFDPAALRLTDADVTELGALVADAQSLMNAVNAARMEVVAKTKALSARGGAHDRLVAKLRAMANVARASDASPGVLASIGVRRKAFRPTLRNAPLDPPEFLVDGVMPGVISVRFRTLGSAQPRARARHTTGVQIAVVNGAQPAVGNEADTVPTVHVSRAARQP